MKKLGIAFLLLVIIAAACAPKTRVEVPNPNKVSVDTVWSRRVIRG